MAVKNYTKIETPYLNFSTITSEQIKVQSSKTITKLVKAKLVDTSGNSCNLCRAKVAPSFEQVRNPCDIAATNRIKNRTWFTSDFEVAILARQKSPL